MKFGSIKKTLDAPLFFEQTIWYVGSQETYYTLPRLYRDYIIGVVHESS